MESCIQITDNEFKDMCDLLSRPNDIKNVFNIKKNIVAYANLEKIDGYALTHLGKINNLANKLVDELYLADKISKYEILYNYIKNIIAIDALNISTLSYIMILHRLNKKFNKYLLN